MGHFIMPLALLSIGGSPNGISQNSSLDYEIILIPNLNPENCLDSCFIHHMAYSVEVNEFIIEVNFMNNTQHP